MPVSPELKAMIVFQRISPFGLQKSCRNSKVEGIGNFCIFAQEQLIFFLGLVAERFNYICVEIAIS